MRLKLGPCSTVTQATSKSTAVTCEGAGGQITMNAAALAASTSVGFTVTNSYVASGDTINLSISSGGTVASYVVLADTVAAGSFKIHLRNVSGGSLSEAVVVNFSVIKNNF
jgi:hypothetical protein